MAVVMTVFDRFHSFPRVCSNMHRVWILSALAAVIAFIGCGREKCLDSTDCEGGFVCRTDRCVVLECIGQDTCADDEVCAAGRFIDVDPSKAFCTARCSVFNRCPEGRHCSDGLCLASGEDTDVIQSGDSGWPDADEPDSLEDRDNGGAISPMIVWLTTAGPMLRRICRARQVIAASRKQPENAISMTTSTTSIRAEIPVKLSNSVNADALLVPVTAARRALHARRLPSTTAVSEYANPTAITCVLKIPVAGLPAQGTTAARTGVAEAVEPARDPWFATN